MQIEYTTDHLPRCPVCNKALTYQGAAQELESLGGYLVEYYKCEKGHGSYELIEDELHRSN